MPLLKREDIYNVVPGQQSTNPTASNTGSGTGLTSNSFLGNQFLGREADKQFFISSFVTDYANASRQYAADTGQFGMLASFYGPNARYAASLNVRDIYGTSTALDSKGNQINVNATVNWDLANQQQQFGTIAWYRNLVAGQKGGMYSSNPDAYTAGYNIGLDYIASRNVKFGTAYNEVKTQHINSMPLPFEYSEVSGPGIMRSPVYHVKPLSYRSPANMRNF